MWAYLIPIALAAVLAILCLPGPRRDGPTVVTTPEPEHIATVAPHVVTIRPPAAGTGAFAYDNGLAIDGPDEEDEDT